MIYRMAEPQVQRGGRCMQESRLDIFAVRIAVPDFKAVQEQALATLTACARSYRTQHRTRFELYPRSVTEEDYELDAVALREERWADVSIKSSLMLDWERPSAVRRVLGNC